MAKRSRGWSIINPEALKTPPEWLAAAIYVLAALLLAYVAYMIVLGLVAFTNLGHQIVTGVAATPSKNEGGGSLTVFFTVLLALVGGPLLIWRVITSHVQAQAARHQALTAREGHYTDLFTKAVEQLGATREVKTVKARLEVSPSGEKFEPWVETEPNLEVRLGAIYALERIARDSERDHWPIMEVLCAYIRNPQNCGTPKPKPDAPIGSIPYNAWPSSIPETRVDVQAALTVIGRRPGERIAYEASHNLSLDLSNANLQRAKLTCGQFASAVFISTNFEHATLVGANLNRAYCFYAKFEDALLNKVTLYGAHLERTDGLNSTILASALGDASTSLPSRIARPKKWDS